MTIAIREAALVAALDRHPALAIAVSGGVDSMVLAHVGHRLSQAATTAVHAVSPAVPALATARVEDHARRFGWRLRLIDAGELADPAYRANPVDRCFYCKSNLYSRIREVIGGSIASGTNLDDLDDFRPGLDAARRAEVVHPFVEAGLGKADIYELARAYGLDDLAALPAQPCLASRIETGIGVDEDALAFIEAVEIELAAALPGAEALRCRITAAGVFAECAPLPEGPQAEAIAARVAALAAAAGRPFGGLRAYRRGAAFLRDLR
ncbi:adenine nucleotide alpha hydrolase [Siculibacillus lacustris]|uniref:Adenine nucleotide alpha hydrolase n=1 Tax=Siculibacillus lacustris TaxID=1549641 RepID=A0A4Q9VXG4_9HYPH|nr:adenine nucleotide alpha hydrolase [Siculibacillus lacustris]TBW41167.1 adenine nucleotide alpha hydrolase [Siculibacillus lacustris]